MDSPKPNTPPANPGKGWVSMPDGGAYRLAFSNDSRRMGRRAVNRGSLDNEIQLKNLLEALGQREEPKSDAF